MNIIDHIKKIHETLPAMPGKLYHTGLRIKETIPYQDTGNLHDVYRFVWFEYIFGHTPGQTCFNGIYSVMYDYKAGPIERDWFDQKCTDLFNLGFRWSESSGTFYLTDTWSTYWEQVNNYDKKEWDEYMAAINKAIASKVKPSI